MQKAAGFIEKVKKLLKNKDFAEILKELQITKEALFQQHKDVVDLLEQSSKIHVGNFSCSGNFGFVLTKNNERVFIPPPFIGSAIDGDTVYITIVDNKSTRKEGAVISIISRNRTNITGIIKSKVSEKVYEIYVPSANKYILCNIKKFPKNKLSILDRICMKLHSLEDGVAEIDITKNLGNFDSEQDDISYVIKNFNIDDSTIEEEDNLFKDEEKGRVDLTESVCFTIDPETAKDLDDAVFAKKHEDGHYTLIVHIADVSHYVKPGSKIDIEAAKRCNSFYFPSYVIPMLPKSLSDNKCSLLPKTKKMALTTIIKINSNGDIKGYKFFKSFIKTSHRFNYDEIQEILDGKKVTKWNKDILIMAELAEILRNKRAEKGCIFLNSIPETKVLLDDNFCVTTICGDKYSKSHQIIEELMLMTNIVVATHLTHKKVSFPYRVHPPIDDRQRLDIINMCVSMGYKINKNASIDEVIKFLNFLPDTDINKPILEVEFIKRTSPAKYSIENIGHSGLKEMNYTHFTSPIRRYIDLIIHRLISESCSYTNEELKEIALNCSERERVAAKSENFMLNIKKFRVIYNLYKKNNSRIFEATVLQIKNDGILVKVDVAMMEASIFPSDIISDFFSLKGNKLVGKRGYTIEVGDTVYLTIKNVDMFRLKFNFTAKCMKNKKK